MSTGLGRILLIFLLFCIKFRIYPFEVITCMMILDKKFSYFKLFFQKVQKNNQFIVKIKPYNLNIQEIFFQNFSVSKIFSRVLFYHIDRFLGLVLPYSVMNNIQKKSKEKILKKQGTQFIFFLILVANIVDEGEKFF